MKNLMNKFRGKRFFVTADNLAELIGKRICYRFVSSDGDLTSQGIADIKAIDVNQKLPFTDIAMVQGVANDLEGAFIEPWGERNVCLRDVDHCMEAVIIEEK